jgi:hypothetical protein
MPLRSEETLTKLTWTPALVSALDLSQLRTLRENAVKLGEQEVTTLCDAELAVRAPAKTKEPKAAVRGSRKKGQSVTEFHFICPRGHGVSRNPDGTFWSGVWVVDQVHAVRAVEIGTLLALHESKAHKSYEQGQIKGWRKVGRDRQYGDVPAKREEGIDFLVSPTDEPLVWVGNATGEKGYKWSDH